MVHEQSNGMCERSERRLGDRHLGKLSREKVSTN